MNSSLPSGGVIPGHGQAIAIRPESLVVAVRRALGDPGVAVTSWGVARIEGGFGPSTGVFRVQGEAHAHGIAQPFSLVLKVAAHDPLRNNPTTLHYWRREALAFGSGLLDDLPGALSAPACHLVEAQSDGSVGLWLEDVADEGSLWSIDRYSLAARHFGAFSGAYPHARPLPSYPWLCPGYLRGWLAGGYLAHDAETIRSSGLRERGALLRLAANAPGLVDRLGLEPRTLCHNDAFRRNLIAGPSGTVALDWEVVGPGAVGEDPAHLFGVGVFLMETRDIDSAELSDAIFDGYVAGLREAGWPGDFRGARFGFAAAAAVRWATTVGALVVKNADPAVHAGTEAWLRRPISEVMDRWHGLLPVLAGLAEEALAS